jgi:hypothetical protein
METLVIALNPADFSTWPDRQKVERWERVMQWHEWAAQQNAAGVLTHAWGSQALTDSEYPSPYNHLLVAVYRTEDYAEFDRLREADPLLDISEYLTTPLISLPQLKIEDERRFQDLTDRVRRDDPVNNRVFEEHEAVIRHNPPNFVGEYPDADPANPRTDFNEPTPPDAPLVVLLSGVNPNEYVETWDDMTRLLHCQKMVWWHDYIAMLYAQGHVTHAWGHADYTSSIATTGKTGGNIAIYRTKDFEQFDGLYRIDPVRSKNLYQSIALRPIAEQREGDRRRLELARHRAVSTFA